MKKFILPILFFLVSLFFLPQTLSAQTDLDCRKVYDKEDYKCLGVFNECNKSCVDSAYAGQSLEVDGGKLYNECIKANDCEGKSRACHDQTQADYRACLGQNDQEDDSEESNKQPKNAKGFVDINPLEAWVEFISDPSSIVKETEILVKKLDVSESLSEWYVKTGGFNISRQPEEGSMWTAEQKTKDLWVKPKGENEYKPFNSRQTVEVGSYVKVSEPTDFWVRGVGKVQLRPGPSGNALVAIEESNGAISPLILLGEMEVAYENPVDENTQKPADWEKIKFVVKTPNASVTVSRTHYLVRFDEKENKTTVAVREGQVEVKSTDGKVVSITPDGGQPGVVVVTQKLSPVKLAVAGAVLAVVVGGIIWFLKKKIAVKSSNKR